MLWALACEEATVVGTPEFDVTNLNHRRAVHRWERVSIGDVFERLTWSYPDKVALIGHPGAYADERFAALTYRQADELANQVANALLGRGLPRSARVLLICENSVEAFITKIGIAKAGLVAMPINPNLAPDVVRYLIEKAEPALAVVDAELLEGAAPVLADTGVDVAAVIGIGAGPTHGHPSFVEFVAGAANTEPEVSIHGDDIWELLFTSGTTAMPKGVMLSHSAGYLAALNFGLSLTRGLRVECDLRVGTFLPLIYHVADQIFSFSAFLAGGSLVIGRRPVAADVADAVARHAITALWGGSPQLIGAVIDELDRAPRDVSGLKVLFYGWGQIPPPAAERLLAHTGQDLLLVGIFGQTESIACYRFWPAKWPEIYQATAPALNYVGVPSPLLASDVVDETGKSLRGQPGVAGEAVYRSPIVTSGYYLDEPATREAFRDGWFHSGDSCTLDENDLRIMVDRFKDIVKSGGENVSSIRVEAVLYGHPAVLRAARTVGGGGHRGDRAQARRERHRAGAARALPRPARRVRVAQGRGLRRRAPGDGRRQGPQVQAAREARRTLRGFLADDQQTTACDIRVNTGYRASLLASGSGI
jgi:acyl-CoA synthetase (AMP-forming)/AMP-acid ligase II